MTVSLFRMGTISVPKEIGLLRYSNMDGSFFVDDSNSFFSPYKILPIAQENKYLGIFSFFVMALYVVCTH